MQKLLILFVATFLTELCLAQLADPKEIHVVVALKLSDGFGDIAKNIRAAHLLKQRYPNAKVNLLVPKDSLEATHLLLGKDGLGELNLIELKGPQRTSLPKADFMFMFSAGKLGEFLPDYIAASCDNRFLYRENSEGAFHISQEAPPTKLHRSELAAALSELGFGGLENLEKGKIAWSYTYDAKLDVIYSMALADYARNHPKETFYHFIPAKHSEPPIHKSLVNPPDNLKVISYTGMPLHMSEAIMRHADLPMLLTGEVSISTALDNQKPFFYEMRQHKVHLWQRIMDSFEKNPNTPKDSLKELNTWAIREKEILSQGRSPADPQNATRNLRDFFISNFDNPIQKVFQQNQDPNYRARYSVFSQLDRIMAYSERFKKEKFSPFLSRCVQT